MCAGLRAEEMCHGAPLMSSSPLLFGLRVVCISCMCLTRAMHHCLASLPPCSHCVLRIWIVVVARHSAIVGLGCRSPETNHVSAADRNPSPSCYWLKNRTLPLRATHVIPRSIARRASQYGLFIDNGKYYGSARELIAFQWHVYQPIGRYE
jgi:hypothetical protein